MSQFEFGKIAYTSDVLTDREIRNIFTEIAGFEPKSSAFSKVKRKPAYLSIDFPATHVKDREIVCGNGHGIFCKLLFKSPSRPCDIEVGEVIFVTNTRDSIDTVKILDRKADVIKATSRDFCGHKRYKAIFQKPVTFSTGLAVKVWFASTKESTVGSTQVYSKSIEHSFNIHGHQIALSLGGGDNNYWYFLLGFKMRFKDNQHMQANIK